MFKDLSEFWDLLVFLVFLEFLEFWNREMVC